MEPCAERRLGQRWSERDLDRYAAGLHEGQMLRRGEVVGTLLARSDAPTAIITNSD